VVVEHNFVTTLPRDQALGRASAFLSRGGFAAQTQTAFALDQTAWTSIEVKRGKPIPSMSLAIPDLPQKISLEWDRGRVSVAASISDQHSAKKRAAMMLSIVQGLENLLAKGHSEDQAIGEWYRIDTELRRSGRWYKFRRVGMRIFIFVVVFGLTFYLARRR
jgi:hypothetical protein